MASRKSKRGTCWISSDLECLKGGFVKGCVAYVAIVITLTTAITYIAHIGHSSHSRMASDRLILPAFAIIHLLFTLIVASGAAPLLATLVALSPANSFFVHFYLWNVVTYPFLDRNFLLATIHVLILLSAGRYIQRNFLHTTYQLLAFVVLATGFSIFWIEMFFFIFTRWESFLFHEFSGLSVITATLIVALKLLIGKRALLPKALPALKFNHLPSILLAFSVICLLSGGVLSKEFLPLSLGTYYSWLYIRFFRVDPSTDLIGNTSADFQLDALFPSSFRPALAPIFNIVFKIVVLLGCLKKYVVQYEGLASSESSSSQLQDDFASSIDRRKKIALQAIEEKLRVYKHERTSPTTTVSRDIESHEERSQPSPK